MNMDKSQGSLLQVIFAFLLIVILTITLTGCANNEQTAEKSSPIPAAVKISKLDYIDDTASYEYLKQALTENRGISQCAYALYETGSISLDEEGNFSFPGNGPGFTIKSTNQDITTEFTETPMSIQIIGKIDMGELTKAIEEDKGVTIIGKGSYKHATDGTKKSLFLRNNYELTSYTENAECELEFVYNADSDRITGSSKDYFDAKRTGKTTSVYDDSTSESEFNENNKEFIRLEFVPK